MNAALVLDLDAGFPVESAVLGRTLAAYPFLACRASRQVQRIYLVSDAPAVKAVGLQYNAVIVDPPAAKGSPGPLFLHGVRHVLAELESEKSALESLALLFTHAGTVTGDLIEAGLELLHSRADAEAVLSVCKAGPFEPSLSRRLSPSGWLETVVPEEPDAPEIWFPNWALAALRGQALKGLLAAAPRSRAPWLELKALPLKQDGPGPVEQSWQIPSLELWLKKHGVADLTPSRELQPKPQPQAAPKPGR